MCTEEYELQSCSPEIELAWSKRGGRRVTATASRPIRQRTDEVCHTLPQLHPCMLTILFTSIHTIQSDLKTHVNLLKSVVKKQAVKIKTLQSKK